MSDEIPELIRDEETGEQGFIADCWCGVKEAWHSVSGLPLGCGASGTLHCECGGDLCVCHNHGEVDCDGCEDCDWEYSDEC